MPSPLCWSPPSLLRAAPDHGALPSGAPLTVRLLDPSDGRGLDSFLRDGLSAMSKQRFGAHRPDLQSADEVCRAIGQDQTIRIVATTPGAAGSNELIGYLILHAAIPPDEQARYVSHGCGDLVASAAVRLAPAVADRYQGGGVGRLMIRYATSLASGLVIRTIILWGGTHDENVAGRRLYERTGFRYVGTFETDRPELKDAGPLLNHDMALDVGSAVTREQALQQLPACWHDWATRARSCSGLTLRYRWAISRRDQRDSSHGRCRPYLLVHIGA